MLDVVYDTLLDGIKLLPFLLITYLLMEFLEHKADEKSRNAISKAGRLGPVIGGALGAVPQCGFSTAASNLYAGRVITPGTLIAIFLSTSDEMLPIFISEKVEAGFIIKVVLLKVVIGIVLGLLVDFVLYNILKHKTKSMNICHLCAKEHCHCNHEHCPENDKQIKAPKSEKKAEAEENEGILIPAIKHAMQIFLFVILFSFILNLIFYFVGEDSLRNLVIGKPFVAELLTGIIGLIPNCAASVIITQLYLEGIITFGALMSGLLVGAGVGILVLFRINDRFKENLYIVGILYLLGVLTGMLFELI